MSQFTPSEITVLISLLNELMEIQSNAGCNDYIVDKTKDNLEFAKIFNRVQSNKDIKLTAKGDKIYGFDYPVTQYFIEKISKLKDVKIND